MAKYWDGTNHRVSAAVERSTGNVFVRVKRGHKRGRSVSFTLPEWRQLEDAIGDGKINALIYWALEREGLMQADNPVIVPATGGQS